MNRTELQTYARMGASKRLTDIQAEIAAILSAFPDLAAPQRKRDLPELPVRKKYSMSPEAKAKVAARMKKYWAERRRATQAAPDGHRYPKRKPRLLNKEGRVVAP